MTRTDLLFVLGSPRSGTSALTRVLSLCGCSLPGTVYAAADQNPRGFWEPVEATKLNSEFLSRHGSSLEDPSLRLLEGIVDRDEKEAYVQRIQAFLARCPRESALVVKDLRIAGLMGYWVDAATRNGLSVKVIIAIRHPGEVVASLIEAERALPERQPLFADLHPLSAELATATWLKLTLLAERQSRSFPRVVVDYENLLRDCKREVSRISTFLKVQVVFDQGAVSKFLSADLHRQRVSGPAADLFAYSWVSRAYSILNTAAKSGDIDVAVLNDIYEAYRANERTFRTAWEDYRRRFRIIDSRQLPALDAAPTWAAGLDF
jgi:hypothetical protein